MSNHQHCNLDNSVIHVWRPGPRFPQRDQTVSYRLEVYIWMCCDWRCLDTQMCSEWHVVFLSVRADSQSMWLSSGAWLWETLGHRSLVWRLNIGLLLRLDLFICHPTMQWEIGDRRQEVGEGGCLEEQQQGSFSQMDMCLLWDVSSSVTVMRTTSKNRQFSSGASIQQTIKLCLCNLTNSPNILLDRVEHGCWLTRYYSLLNDELLDEGHICHRGNSDPEYSLMWLFAVTSNLISALSALVYNHKSYKILFGLT